MTDIAVEMKKALESEVVTPETTPETPEPEQAAQAAPQAAQAAPEGSEGPPEGSEDTPEKPAEEAPKDEEQKAATEEVEKKSSSYQRLQKKFEATREEAKKAKAESAEALVIANEWRQRAFVIAKELRKVIQDAKGTGYARDTRDDRLLMHQLKEGSKDLRQESAKMQAERNEKAEVEAAAQEFSDRAESLAAKYPSLSKGEILRGYAAVLESSGDSDETPMEEVADLLNARKNRAAASREQIQTNRAAPKPMRQGSSFSRPPEFKADQAGMKSFLKSQGLA